MGSKIQTFRKTWLGFLLVLALFSPLVVSSCYNRLAQSLPPPPREKDQTVFLAIDGIPYTMVEDLFQKNKIRGFQAPSRVIAAFPSTTTTGFTGLFKAVGGKPAPGYDARFFSYTHNEVLGNLLEAYEYEPADYNRFFSYNRNTGFKQIVMYTAPRYALHKDLGYLKPAIWRHPEKETIFFYLGSTDGTGHLDGPEKTRKLLKEIFETVQDLREDYRNEFHRELQVVLFSDHGFHWSRLKKIDLSDVEERLKQAGFALAENLKSDTHVVAITWGNISGGDLYTSENLAPRITQILLEIPGMDLVIYREKDRIVVNASRKGFESAEIVFEENQKEGEKYFGYLPREGDPLNYLPVLEELKKEGKLNPKGMASEKDWFEKTHLHAYPDALYRLQDAFYGLVQNPATLLISTREDYEFGDSWTRFGASLRGGMSGTHGALALESCSAFIISTNPQIKFAPVLRYDQALLPFEETIRRSFETAKTNGEKLPVTSN